MLDMLTPNADPPFLSTECQTKGGSIRILASFSAGAPLILRPWLKPFNSRHDGPMVVKAEYEQSGEQWGADRCLHWRKDARIDPKGLP